MPGISVSIRARGPIYDKDVKAVVKKQLRTAKDAMGDELVKQIDARLNKVLKKQTPYYRTQIDYSINQGNGNVIVHDRGVVYGPWLEGTGSRNKTTRFKGYRTFRQITQQADADAKRIAQDHVRVVVKELS
jgi:hypothetical protein